MQPSNTNLLPATKDNPYPSWTGTGTNPYLSPAPAASTPPAVSSQNGIMQSTSSITAKDNSVSTGIDNVVATHFPVPEYGSDVKDASGKVVGQAMYDPNTGQPLANPKGDPNNGNAPGTGTAGTITTPDGATYSLSQPSGFNYTLPTPADGSKYIYGQDGHPYLQDASGKITTDPVAEAEFTKNATVNKQMSDFNTIIDTYKAGLDSAHTALLDSIKNAAALQTQKTTALNALTLGAKTVAGFRTGSTEYTPEIEMGILKNEQDQGNQRLADIQTQMNVAIAQAVSAKNDKDFELATKTFETINALQKQKEDAVQALYKNYTDSLKLIDDKLKAAHTSAITDLKTAAPALVQQYDGFKNADDKQKYIDALAKKTGLDPTLILGEMDKTRADAKKNKEQTATEKKKAQDDDIASAVLDFQKQMKDKNWAGVNPEAYQYYKDQILKLYGASAVLAYDKAIKDANLSVDDGTGL